MTEINVNTVLFMSKQGGSFVTALAEAWLLADSINKTKLENTFEYFNEYAELYNKFQNQQKTLKQFKKLNVK